MKLEVGMYIRSSYYSYKGKIGKIIKNYHNELEIAYKDSIVKTTVNSFIDDNYDINGKQYKASHNIIDLIEDGDYVNGFRVKEITKNNITFEGANYTFLNYLDDLTIESIVTKEQYQAMEYKIGDE